MFKGPLAPGRGPARGVGRGRDPDRWRPASGSGVQTRDPVCWVWPRGPGAVRRPVGTTAGLGIPGGENVGGSRGAGEPGFY